MSCADPSPHCLWGRPAQHRVPSSPAPLSHVCTPASPLPLPAAPSPSPPRSSLLLLLPSQRRCRRRSPAALGPDPLDADKSRSFPSGSRRARPISASGSTSQERPSPVTNLHRWPWALRLVWISQLGSPLGQGPCSGMPSPLAHHFPEMLIVPLRCSPMLHVRRPRLSHPPRAPSSLGACGGLVEHLCSPLWALLLCFSCRGRVPPLPLL